ncbi:hypothetical protein JCM9140_868 [Halalkalibacter wakoensis JCM 9140]|uniref:Uncharacterized protein n=2 Tax=Halalkalibacter wakoensis TaxID=127891 RepID=W4PZ00_9BACI|nr:hypothetical protein JCM9140_868 [Halalkalibacter wakoensis JCM 9140]
MGYTRENEFHPYQPPNSLFALSNEFQIFMTFTFPVLLAIFMFRYIHVKLTSDFTHSLPLKREQLFHQHVVFGLVVIIVPLFLTALSLTILGLILPYKELLSFTSVLEWFSFSALFHVFVFLTGVFVAMFTGMSILQGALTYILFLFPVGVTVLFISNLEFYLFGFTATYYLDSQIEKYIPFIRLSQLERLPLTLTEGLGYVLLCFIFYVCALLVYKKRDTETATQAIAFPSLRPIFKYGVTFCTMLVGGLYFGSLQGGLGWILFGYLLGSFAGYFLSIMMLEKSLKVFSKWKGYVAYVIAVAIIGFAIQIDVFGFEKKLPAVEDIEGIYFGDSIYSVIDHEASLNPTYIVDQRMYINPTYFYEQPETINSIHHLHEQIIQEKDLLKKTKDQRNSVAIRYNLKEGSDLIRYYEVPLTIYQKQYREIAETTEFKENQNPVLKINDLSTLEHITLNSYYTERRVTITEREDIEEFHQLIQSDIKNETFEEIQDYRSWWTEISYEFSNNQYLQFSWKKSYTEIENWLEEKGLIEQARVTEDDLSHIYVLKNDEKRDIYDVVYGTEYGNDLSRREGAVKIEDPSQLNEILRIAGGDYRGEYIIGFYFKNSLHPQFESISTENAPDFLRKALP